VILAADIGGTNTRLALLDGTVMRPDSVVSYPNAGAASLYDHIERYMAGQSAAPDCVALALAGPVAGTSGDLTNRNWHITTQQGASAAGAPACVLLNDLQAQGCALAHLTPDVLVPIHTCAQSGAPSQSPRTKLVIGLGTGMNIACVHPLPGGADFVPAAEAGHITFSPHDPELRDFAKALGTYLDGHVAAEDVLSGRGLAHAYRFTSGAQIAPEQVIALAETGDAQALHATTLIARALGEHAGDMALVHLAKGGVYLVGGLARAMAPFLTRRAFTAPYTAKGRFSDLVADIDVHVVYDDFAALTGAAQFACDSAARAD